MNIEFINKNKVRLSIEIEAKYKRPVVERCIYNLDYARSEFLKIYPDKEIVNVLRNSKINNFSDDGVSKGVWVFELKPTGRVTEAWKKDPTSKNYQAVKATSKVTKKRKTAKIQ
jgi:L-ribulose-5-phosphate 3-epimerase UlaE